MKRQENRAVLAWRRAVSTGLVSTADWAYMKAPVPRPPFPAYGTKSPKALDTVTRCVATLVHFGAVFSQNRNGREAILGLSRLDCSSAKTGGTVNGGA